MNTRMIRIDDLPVNDAAVHAQEVITNARHPDVAPRLAERGIDAGALDALQQHLDAFVEAADAFTALRAEKDDVAETFDIAVDAFRRGAFQNHVGLADAAFIDDTQARILLGISDGVGNVDTRYVQWYSLASRFYGRLLADDEMLGAVSRLNVTPDELKAGADEVARLHGLYETRNRLDNRRQQARRTRDRLRAVLETELRRLQKVAAIVLADTPDYLEGLGFIVASE